MQVYATSAIAAGQYVPPRRKRVLFICSMGKIRSPTAAKLFADRFETKYLGIFTDVPRQTLYDLSYWADIVVCMEQIHADAWEKLMGEGGQVWHIPDEFAVRDDPILIEMLERAAEDWGLYELP